MQLKVIIEPGEDGGFIASVPALRGCWSQGVTRQETMKNIREAIEGWLEVEQDKFNPQTITGEIETVQV